MGLCIKNTYFIKYLDYSVYNIDYKSGHFGFEQDITIVPILPFNTANGNKNDQILFWRKHLQPDIMQTISANVWYLGGMNTVRLILYFSQSMFQLIALDKVNTSF